MATILSLNIWNCQIFYLHLHNKFSTTMLTKKDKKKRYNKSVKSRGHSFAGTWTDMTKDAFKDNAGGAVGGLISAASAGIGAGMTNAELQGVEEAQADIDQRANFQSTASTNDDLLAEMASATNAKSDYTVRDFRQSGSALAKNTIMATLQGGAGGASAGPWGAVAGAAAGLLGGIGGVIGGFVNARKKKDEMNEAAKKANLAQAQTLTAKAGALDQAADQRALAAYAAYGGDINTPKFSDFPSEITEFNTGGSHEENPYDGIPQGIAPDGLPNLVEEGEVKFDNYIFSDRLMLNKKDKKKYKFLKGKTYADAAKAIKKELGIDERPNDLIAKADLEEQLTLLSMLQEEERAKRGLRGENRMMYARGGHLFAGPWKTYDDILPYGEKGDKQTIGGLPSELEAKLQIRPLEAPDSTIKLSDLDLTNIPRYTSEKSKTNNSGNWGSSLLQSMPAIGSAIGTIASIFDKPTYEHTKKLTQSEKPITPITYTPIHQDIRLNRFDTNYHANKLVAQAGATRRAIREQTASNPYTSIAALLSADANAQSQMGDLYRKAAEYNQGLALQEAQFNSAGRRADAEGLLKAASANATLQDKALARQAEKDIYAARLNMAEDQAYDTAVSANMTSLFDNLGAMGKEKISTSLGLINNLLEAGQVEAAEQLAQNIFGNEFTLSRSAIPAEKSSDSKKSYGGKIKTKRKKGYTI